MAENRNIGSREPLFNNRILQQFSIKYGFLSLLLFFSGLFLFPNPAYLATITSDNIVDMTNQERQEKGVPILHINDSLEQAARQKAETILEEQKFAHELQGKKFSYWIEKNGYDYKYTGENLAIDFTKAENVVSSWMSSDAHRRNMLDSEYKEIGVSVLRGDFQGQETIVVTQIFGTPKNVEPNFSAQSLNKNTEQKSSSSTLQIASAASGPTGKFFLLESIFSDIRKYELPQEYRHSILVLVVIFLFYIKSKHSIAVFPGSESGYFC
jgi:hypothetical protein